MSLFLALINFVRLWFAYGPVATKAIDIVNQIANLDGGRLFHNVDAILKANGVDIAAILSSINGPSSDLTTIAGIQHAMNIAGANPRILEDGVIGSGTIASIKAYQRQFNQAQTGIPDLAFCTALLKALPA